MIRFIGGITEGNEELVQDIQRYGLYRGEMRWRSVGLTKTKTFGAGVSQILYNDVKTICPTFIKKKRQAASTGKPSDILVFSQSSNLFV